MNNKKYVIHTLPISVNPKLYQKNTKKIPKLYKNYTKNNIKKYISYYIYGKLRLSKMWVLYKS
jgi:hypothetical protein